MKNDDQIQEMIQQQIVDCNPRALFADGFEGCLLGCTSIRGRTVAVYSRSMCISKLMKDGMDFGEAVEYFDFNVESAYVGPNTPIFLDLSVLSEGNF